jgi:hypothetical protein
MHLQLAILFLFSLTSSVVVQGANVWFFFSLFSGSQGCLYADSTSTLQCQTLLGGWGGKTVLTLSQPAIAVGALLCTIFRGMEFVDSFNISVYTLL